jgi:hypothetical protein
MNLRGVSLVIVVLAAVCAVPVVGQQKLGDLVAQGGYDWLIGRWIATNDQGEKVEFRYEWGLDKRIVVSDTVMSGFTYHGIAMLSPSNGEVLGFGADNRGCLWKGTWSEDSAGLVYRTENTSPTGEVRKVDVVHSRVDADTITIAIYAVDSSGSRSGDAWAKGTYKRQTTPAATIASASGQAGGSTDYQTLGDVVSQGGYEWLIGKWVATKEDRTYELEHMPILNKHASLVSVKIGDFRYQGLITYAPASQEISQIGTDSMGRLWEGTWQQGDEGAVYKADITKDDGTTQKIQLVYVKGDNDTLKTKEYSVESGSPMLRDELTFKRQKP